MFLPARNERRSRHYTTRPAHAGREPLFADSPTASIPGACHDTAEVRAAYRFFDHEDIDFWDVLAPHIRSTERRMSEHPVVLCLQDTSSLDFNGQDIEGLGPLNYEPQRGLLIHPTYAVTPGREPLGVLDSWNWARRFKDGGGKRPADIVESRRWVDGYERIVETAASMPNTRCVSVGDRESDLGDRESDLMPLMKRAAELGHPADCWFARSTIGCSAERKEGSCSRAQPRARRSAGSPFATVPGAG